MKLPFTRAFKEAGPFGTLVGVHLPQEQEDAPPGALEALHPLERELALSLAPRRRCEWIGGRLALRGAAAELGIELAPVLRGPRGEPLLPSGWSGSISHKRRLAVAVLAPGSDGTLGIDLEELLPERMAIRQKILRPEEEEQVQGLPEARRWDAVLARFAVKEAVYKALHPHVNRFVGFHEATVDGEVEGEPRVRLHLREEEGAFRVEAMAQKRDGLLIAQVRLSRA